MSRIIPVPLPDFDKTPSPPTEMLKSSSTCNDSDSLHDGASPRSSTLLRDVSNGNEPSRAPFADKNAGRSSLGVVGEFDPDADKENIPPLTTDETGLGLTASAETMPTPFLTFDFDHLEGSSRDAEREGEKPESDPWAGKVDVGGGNESSGGEEEESALKKIPAMQVLLDMKVLKRRISASTLSSGTDYTSEFGLSRCSSPTRSVVRPRNSGGGSALSRVVGQHFEDLFDDYMEARSATPVGAVCPLPVTDTLGIETLLVSESPRPLADPELPAEDLTALRHALDAVAATLPVNEVKEPEEPLSGSRDFLIELAPGPA